MRTRVIEQRDSGVWREGDQNIEVSVCNVDDIDWDEYTEGDPIETYVHVWQASDHTILSVFKEGLSPLIRALREAEAIVCDAIEETR
jgi:hypothetical protein